MSADPMTDHERLAMDHLVAFVNVMRRDVIGNGPTRSDDVRELVDKVHQLQAVVMSQACARMLPDEYRLLGGVVRKDGDS